VKPERSLLCSQEPATGPYHYKRIQSTLSQPTSLRFILILSSRLNLGLWSRGVQTDCGDPTRPPNQWVPGALRIKRPGSEADHSPPPSAKVKNEWSYTSASPIHLHGVVFSSKHRDNFTFLLCRGC